MIFNNVNQYINKSGIQYCNFSDGLIKFEEEIE